ncbi:MAG: calcium-binding protein [Leptolyngbyaceae cyanobacterium CRU_2_3]|nr:calcium-binding protein [Leptolyngbyaceae cyanobacterium CRU_2_3]
MVFSEPTQSHANAFTQQAVMPPFADVGYVALMHMTLREGDRPNAIQRGTAQNDLMRGSQGNDTLLGLRGADHLYGDRGNDILRGGAGADRLTGGRGKNYLAGDGGNDQLVGSADHDVLVGGKGNDRLEGRGGKNLLTGGTGKDTFVLSKKFAGAIASASGIQDFTSGQDLIQLVDLKFTDLAITQGKGSEADIVLIQNQATGEYLVSLAGMQSRLLKATDFLDATQVTQVTQVTDPADSGDPAIPEANPAIASLNSNPIQFLPSDSETAIATRGAAHIQLGTQTIYIGTQQVSSNNQNPIIVSFDSSNPKNRWTQTEYEVTGADGRGYGLFWSGQSFYAVFSVDGTQGTPDQDFRRVSSGATQSWLRSYGAGGGPKVSVLARLNLSTGDMTEAVYLSAVLSSGKSNSLAIAHLSTNRAGNLVINAQSYYAPRRPDGQAMTQMTPGSSPFNYTLEITPDLKTVVNTAAIGWQ